MQPLWAARKNANLAQILVLQERDARSRRIRQAYPCRAPLFFGFGLLGICLFWLVLGPLIALHAPAWLAWLPFLFGFPLLLLAIGSWAGILMASTKRFVRHLSQP
jgi:hypothetical protein